MRILFLTHRLPYAPNRGDRTRAFHMLHFLARRADVDLISLSHDDEETTAAAGLRQVAASVHVARVSKLRGLIRSVPALLGDTPLTHVLLDSPQLPAQIDAVLSRGTPDVVLGYCSGMARFALKPPLDRLPLVLDLVDVDSEKWRMLAERTHPPLGWIYAREAQRLRAFEALAATAARTTLVVNEREAAVARRVAPHANVTIAPVGVDIDYFRPPNDPVPDARVVFCGVMNYTPNEDGVLWFIRHVWPIVRQHRSDARFVIVGASPMRRLLAACHSDPTIEITGSVADVRQYVWNSSVAVAPLSIARGTQTKVLEMVAAGLPTVVTPAVADGLPSSITSGCVVAADADAFARAVLDILAMTPAVRRGIANRAQLSELGWDRVLAPLWHAVAAAVESPTTGTLVAAG